LSEPRPIILKIGGSVITDKNGELAPHTEVIDRLAGEIQKANVKSLVVVHGGGSFGHPTAQKHAIKDGYKEDAQKMGFSETHHVMTVLNGLVMDALVWHVVPAVSVSPSSCIITENGRIRSFEDTPLRMMLNMGFYPVLFGDAVLDTKMGFTVLSGDQLVSALATSLKTERVIIGVDVDGIYDADPKVKKAAKMIDHLTLTELRSLQGILGKSTACDVTGGMFGKMTELVPAIEHGTQVSVVNATTAGNVYRALAGERVRGTTIQKE